MARKKQSPRDGMERTRIHLWRHPEVVGGVDGMFWGQTDVALTKRGQGQQRAMAAHMAQFKLAAIYSSDLQRTLLPAEAIGRAQKPRLKPEPRPAFRELNLGAWEGLTYQEIDQRYPGALNQRASDLAGYRIDQGESLEDLAERVIPAFQEMVGEHRGKEICLVAHAGVNRVILTKLLGAPLERLFRLDQSYAALNLIDVFSDGVPLIRGLNLEARPPEGGRRSA
jgi:alpha-ribazole phosphatase/probable phosphoglycerate mutase